MDLLKQEIRYAIRVLMRNPLFAVVAILTLAIGIGANSAIFSAVYSVLLKPLSYTEPDRLVFVVSDRQSRSLTAMSPVDLRDVSQSGVFEKTAAITTGTMDLTGKGEPERFPAAFVSWNFFQLLGVQPIFGRAFTEKEGVYGAEKVVVISHGLWKRRFASDPKVVGSAVSLDGRKRTVVGIAPPEFDYPSKVQIWGVLSFTPHEVDQSQRGARWVLAIGRLASGVTLEQAQVRTLQFSERLAKQYPRSNEDVRFAVRPMQGALVQKAKPALLVLWAAVAFVLLIACVNVTNLLLAQAARRQTEVAIRTALGAGRMRLIRQFVVESLVLSITASAVGVVIALWATELFIQFGSPHLPALQQIHLDSTVLIFTLTISVLTGLLIGVIPALQSVHKAMPQKLKSGVRISGRNKIRRGLAVIEIATALILLAGAGLLIKSFYRLTQIHPGFRAEGILSFELSLPDSVYGKPHQVSNFYNEFMNGLKTHPNVEEAAAVFGLPMSKGYSASTSFALTGKPTPADEPSAGLRVVTPEYFRTLGIPLLKGRTFSDTDTDTSGDVVILSESAARAYWPNEDPIGQKIDIHVSLTDRGYTSRTIVGVVGDVRFQDLETQPEPDLYIPHTQQQLNAMMVVVRASGKTENLAGIIRTELRKLDPNLPISNLQTMEEVVGASFGQRKFTMLLLSIFAAVGLFLAALGTYGVLSFQVVQRTQEIGIRLALGAKRRDVFKLVLQEGLFLAVTGTLIGLIGVLATGRFLKSLVYGVSTIDPVTFGSVVFLLTFVALLACYIPARRATRVDPITTLRYE